MAMHRLEQLEIRWNDDIDAYMTQVESKDRVLKAFFRIHDWDFIRHIFQAVADESSVEYDNKSIVYEQNSVRLHVGDDHTQLEKAESLNIFFYLFDLMIVGANDDHHGVRYEPWWQEFTEVSYQLKYKIDLQSRL
jgi:hypothetical protein